MKFNLTIEIELTSDEVMQLTRRQSMIIPVTIESPALLVDEQPEQKPDGNKHPVIKVAKTKRCIVCGNEFEPRCNRQMKCSGDCIGSKEPEIETVKEVKPKSDYVRKEFRSDKDLILSEPVNGKQTRVLKIGEHICANYNCKGVFKANKLNQKYCSVKCEADVKMKQSVYGSN